MKKTLLAISIFIGLSSLAHGSCFELGTPSSTGLLEFTKGAGFESVAGGCKDSSGLIWSQPKFFRNGLTRNVALEYCSDLSKQTGRLWRLPTNAEAWRGEYGPNLRILLLAWWNYDNSSPAVINNSLVLSLWNEEVHGSSETAFQTDMFEGRTKQSIYSDQLGPNVTQSKVTTAICVLN